MSRGVLWVAVAAAWLSACDGEDTDKDPVETDPPVDTEAESDAPIEVTYADVQAIFDVSCATSGCHNGTFEPDLRASASPASMVNVAAASAPGLDYVVPGDPDNSYLLHKINGTQTSVGGSGARMPTAGCCLSDEEVGMISTWIYNGALAE